MAKREDAPNAPQSPPGGKDEGKDGEKKARKSRSTVNTDAVITLIAEGNPKRPGSAAHGRFAFYTSGMTVKQALEAGVTMADIHHDSSKGFIKLSA